MRVMLTASTAGHINQTAITRVTAPTSKIAQNNPNQNITSYSILSLSPVCQYGAPRHAPRSNCETPDRLSQNGCA
ncbi:hypothetical protein [Escherichia phage Ioannina]|nr:hypothetical protein [Escherichia phage Ioannina]